ncbi:MAG: hypothetical protein IPN75_05715 [Dechloromonas sp.]|uniref:Uncharacterized protein n=1 Tax=Candidatus Dechloromonas phosphorivorans TaxID=2899244 RepID=A0A9D7LT60_9RHOO|nr:hypothetical protein [Candidatus Dechloromonas phosphorivorans]
MIGGLFPGRSSKAPDIPTLYKAAAFSLLVIAFNIIEHVMQHGLAGGTRSSRPGPTNSPLVIFVALIPFFAELGRVLGKGKMWALFFRKREAPANHA